MTTATAVAIRRRFGAGKTDPGSEAQTIAAGETCGHLKTDYGHDQQRDDGRKASQSDSKLERELERGLHQPRRLRVHHVAEQGAVDVALHGRRPKEIRMVEGVERFDTKLQ